MNAVCKYYIPERVIVRNVTLRNMIINRGEAEVDNHTPKGDISDSPSQECNIYFIIPNIFLFAKKVCFCLNSEKSGPMSELY